MDYLDIILKGYFDKNDRLHLTEYLYREFKKAEKEYFTAGTFFDGCMDVIDSWKKDLQRKIFERKNELILWLTAAKNGTLTYDNLQGKTIEQKRLNTIEYCKQELKDVRPDGIGSLSFTVLLPVKYGYSLSYDEILYIKTSIDKAAELTKIKSERKYLKKAIKKTSKLIQSDESEPKATQLKKTYKSFTRAVAIYHVLLAKNTDFTIPESKKDVYALAEKWINPASNKPLGKVSFYQTLSTGKNGPAIRLFSPTDLENRYPLDYQYALSLFNKKSK